MRDPVSVCGVPGTESMSPSSDPSVNRSRKAIPPHERLIVALDMPGRERALALVDALGDSVVFYKLGLELFMSSDSYFDLVAELQARGKKVFVDLKFFDVPETVAAAVRQLRSRHVEFVTVHGNQEMVAAAAQEKNGLKILAVTVLTSLDQMDIEDLGFQVDVDDLVLSRARRAMAAGADGVISSGVEAPALRSSMGDELVIVTPGIRPVLNRLVDDQKRTVDVEQAFLGGADYVVVGRPIRDAPNPRAAADDIQRRIAALFDASPG